MRLTTTFLAIAIVLLSSQADPAQSSQTQTDELQLRSTSPFAIARAVNKSSQTWKKRYIQVNIDLTKTWERLRIDSGNFAMCPGDCEATIFKGELNGRSGPEAILKLTKSHNFCRYLIFTPLMFRASRHVRWELIGNIDHDFNRYQMASHRIVRAFDRNWFVLRAQEGSGSGYYLYSETWFEVNDEGIKPVLNYSADGGIDPGLGGLEWELKGHPSPVESAHSRPAIRLAFEIRYTAKGFDDGPIRKRFIVKRHAEYFRDKKSGVFVFDQHHSTISEREMKAVANSGTEPEEEDGSTKIGGTAFFSNLKGFVGSGFEVFLRLNVGRLTRIARGRETSTKEWLREFIKQCDDIPEKLTLERALNDPLPHYRKHR